jgi:hypothetical protein
MSVKKLLKIHSFCLSVIFYGGRFSITANGCGLGEGGDFHHPDSYRE